MSIYKVLSIKRKLFVTEVLRKYELWVAYLKTHLNNLNNPQKYPWYPLIERTKVNQSTFRIARQNWKSDQSRSDFQKQIRWSNDPKFDPSSHLLLQASTSKGQTRSAIRTIDASHLSSGQSNARHWLINGLRNHFHVDPGISSNPASALALNFLRDRDETMFGSY